MDQHLILTRQFLERQMEGYRRVAFPGKKIRTRDEQNHALVARGSYFAIQCLIKKLNDGESK